MVDCNDVDVPLMRPKCIWVHKICQNQPEHIHAHQRMNPVRFIHFTVDVHV